MTLQEIRDILLRISYKVAWFFTVFEDGNRPVMQIVTPEWKSRKWFLSPHMTKSEIVQTAFKAILTAEEHETRKLFKYRDKPIFGPHFDVDILAELCNDPEAEDKRVQKAEAV